MSWVLFIVSLVANFLMIWYCRELIKQHVFYVQRMEDVLKNIQEYKIHLEEVYGLETYYGDTTLQGLLQHTANLAESIIVLEQESIMENSNKDIKEDEAKNAETILEN
jgi:hypothetical protein